MSADYREFVRMHRVTVCAGQVVVERVVKRPGHRSHYRTVPAGSALANRVAGEAAERRARRLADDTIRALTTNT